MKKSAQNWNATRAAVFLAAILCSIGATNVTAQENQVAFFGGEVLSNTRPVNSPSGGSVQIQSSFAAGASLDHGFTSGRFVVPHVELEFIALPPRTVKSAAYAVPQSYAALYVTPGLRLEFLPRALLHPWVAAGGGYTLYIENQVLTNGQPYSFHFVSRGAFDYGGGFDLRVWSSRHDRWEMKLRAQVRDFFSGNPELNAPLTSSVQHNVIATGGIVLALESK
ncbi:MAG TPA: hypothetical protein VJR23_19050 [Candidatus Acidoferrales bacterium]|nr:hypothetical protein [Candidatus Acidoferrales bacterium]